MKFTPRKILDSVGVFAIYCIISLCIGEWHPFSKFPMYSSFPNWSYAFYLEDGSGEMVPSWDAFQVDAGHIAHQFYGICQHNGIEYGHGMESDGELQFIGDEILRPLHGRFQLGFDQEIRLYRRHFFFEGDSMMHIDTRMSTIHATAVE